MRRALMWLNLYIGEAVRRKLKNSLKTQKIHFFLSLRRTVSQPYRLSHINALRINQFYQGPIHEILAEIAQLLEVVEKLSFFESVILNFFFFFFLLHSHENQSTFIG
jgi:hypothetical protein